MVNLLQLVDYWHWWLLALALVFLAIVRKDAKWVWPAVMAGLIGYLVLGQPGMFWHKQWLFFLIPSAVLMFLARKRA